MARPFILSEQDRAEAKSMRLNGYRMTDIAVRFNCCESTIRDFFRVAIPGFRPKFPSQPRNGIPYNCRGFVTSAAVPPEHLIADRDMRANEPRNLTQLLMGDPPMSQSALARLRSIDTGGRVQPALPGGPIEAQ